MNNYLKRYYNKPEKIIFDTTLFPPETLFPMPNDGVIKPNHYYNNNEIPRYLYTQATIVINALKCFFRGGVYFLWDRERELIKIGCSKNLEKRVCQLINDAKIYAIDDNLCLLGIHPTSPELISKLEVQYHNLFEKYAYKYEWFRMSLTQYNDIINTTSKSFSTFVRTLFLDFSLIYSAIDLIPEEMDTIIDIWPYSQEQIRQYLKLSELETNEITLLVQDHKGNIIPFGWRQDDINYLNEQNIWENQHLICFQKLRMLALNDMRRQNNFAGGVLGI